MNACSKTTRRLLFLAILLSAAGLLPAAAVYTNPVIDEIGPADPTVLYHEGVYYMYPTGDNTSYHVYTSYDLVHWHKGPKVFEPGGINIWAPDVFYHEADDTFYLYYTANFRIGVATADSPLGPFVDQGIILDGYIDAHLFQDDDGKYYLYYTDIGHIYVHEMENPLQLKGVRHLILQPNQAWEMQWGSVNEGPWMIKHEGTYYLLYSGSGADSRFYAVGYATASDPMGPFTKYAGNPIVESSEGLYGPGHGTVTTDAAGNLWHVYHQKNGPDVGWDRFICIDPMEFDENGILHGTATRGTVQPAPVMADHAGEAAYWRFEEGPLDGPVPHGGLGDGEFYPGAIDSSGNGNHLSVWAEGWAGFAYRDDVPTSVVDQTDADNTFSIQNTGGFPGLFTSSQDSNPTGIDLETWTPSAFTIEVAFKPETGGWRTIIGRDAINVAPDENPALAALYLQVTPEDALAIKFADMAGYWHAAQSAGGVIEGWPYPEASTGRWYYAAAVSNGKTLSLYLADVQAKTGYELVAQTDLTQSGSPDTRLTAGIENGDGADWHAGGWSVGRGLFDGGHADRAYGFIDEVRISNAALTPPGFLFYEYNPAALMIEKSTDAIHEAGGDFMDVSVSLESEPNADVTITIEEELARGQISLDRKTLIFTDADWNIPQTIRVTAVDDAVLENAEQKIALSIDVVSADGNYNELEPDPVVVTVREDECGATGYTLGDFDLNCVVDMADLGEFITEWLSCSYPDEQGCVDYIGQ